MQSLPRLPLLLVHLLVYGAAQALFAPGVGYWALVFCALLIWASCTDFARFEIPDTASLLLTVAGFAHVVERFPSAIFDHLLAGLIWPLLFLAIATIFKILRGLDGLGLGDVKLMVGVGLWCGLAETISVVLAAALAAIVALLLSTFFSRTQFRTLNHSKVAFGPFLCLSAWCVWLMKVGT